MSDPSRRHDRPADRLLLAFAGASFLAVSSGCRVTALAGAGTPAWAMNLIAWLLGAAAAVAISRRPPPPTLPVAAAATLGLVLTFAGGGLQEVHRWWEVGPLRLNAAALVLPLTVVALARDNTRLALVAAISILLSVLLMAQPDASQATAFALAMATAIVRPRPRTIGRWLIAMLLVAIAALSWLRLDPLEPVAMVEDVVRLAWKVAPAAGVLGVPGLVLVVATPIAAGGRRAGAMHPGVAASLSIHLGLVCLAPLAGAFPVPLMGLGPSPIFGLWLAIGLLAATARHPASIEHQLLR